MLFLTHMLLLLWQAYAKQEERKQQRDEGSDEDVPDEFIDPIMMTTMTDPVLLPDSHTSIDRYILLTLPIFFADYFTPFFAEFMWDFMQIASYILICASWFLQYTRIHRNA